MLSSLVGKLLTVFLVLLLTKDFSCDTWNQLVVVYSVFRGIWAVVRWQRVCEALSNLGLWSTSGTSKASCISNGISIPLSLRSNILWPLNIIGQICSTFINGRIHNLSSGFCMIMGSLMANIIFVHKGLWLILLGFQLVESLIKLDISQLLLNLVMSSSLGILPLAADPMSSTWSQSFENIAGTNGWNISVGGLPQTSIILVSLDWDTLICHLFWWVSIGVLVWIYSGGNASFWNIELFVYNTGILQDLVCICRVTWCLNLLLVASNHGWIHMWLVQRKIRWVSFILILVLRIHITCSAVYNAGLRNSTITIKTCLAKWMRLILSITLVLVICVLSGCSDISAKLSMTLMGCEILSVLTILQNCLCVDGACHSNCSSKEACGFVHDELVSVLLTSSSWNRLRWVMLWSVRLQDFGL